MGTTCVLTINETLFNNGSIMLCRAVRTDDNTSVLVKIAPEQSVENASELLEKEKATIDGLTCGGIIRALQVMRYNRNPALVLEDFPGRPLALSGRLGWPGISGFLSLALGLAEILAGIHEQHLIHNNISPWSIFVTDDRAGGGNGSMAAITGFERASGISAMAEAGSFLDHRPLQWLSYISPEMTGKVNRAPDRRSDLYSLGAVLYEAATGAPPFNGDNPTDIIYAHLTEKPAPPRRLNGEIPPVISNIIMRLLGKNPEERYQSARSLGEDLKKCLAMVEKSGRLRSFPLGRSDRSGRLVIPDRLYDREQDLAALSAAYGAAEKGANVLVMVSGDTGAGKTALVREFRKTLIADNCFFCQGKFDQYRRDIPFSAFTGAFGGLARQLLKLKDSEIGSWKTRIGEALSPNTKLIMDLVPELQMIIGTADPVPAADPVSAMNRLHRYLEKFARVFASEGNSLVIFLDDLHWADPASLEFLKALASSGETGNLCVIGAYRSGETGPEHPLTAAIAALSPGKEIIHIDLGPIKRSAAALMIGDMFTASPVKAAPLAELVHEKTMGNPFYIHEFLLGIAREPLVRRASRRGWTWDLESIRQLPSTDNVIDFLTAKINGLPADQRELLMIASCIGSTFSGDVLTCARGMRATSMEPALAALIDEGLVVPEGFSFRFVHDRVQEAARRMMTSKDRAAVHYRIAIMVFANALPEGLTDNIFAIADQYNGASEILDEEERANVADLNYLAGRKAKMMGAFETALPYFRTAYYHLYSLQGSAKNIWERHHHLAYCVHLELADSEFLNHNYDRVEPIIEKAVAYTGDEIETANLKNILVVMYTTQFTRHREALDIGLEILRTLGIDINTTNPDEQRKELQAVVKKGLYRKEISSLMGLPPMKDLKMRTAMRILSDLLLPAHYSNSSINDLLIMTMIRISLESGNAPESVPGYLHYGRILNDQMPHTNVGYQFGRLAMDLAETLGSKSSICETCLIFANFIAPFHLSLKDTEFINMKGIKAGIESGNLKHTGDLYSHIVGNDYYQGKKLDTVQQSVLSTRGYLKKIDDRLTLYITESLLVSVIFLKEDSEGGLGIYNKKTYDLANQWPTDTIPFPLNYLQAIEGGARFILGEYDTAYRLLKQAKEIIHIFKGLYIIPEIYYYMTLSMAALYPSSTESDKELYASAMTQHRDFMKILSGQCPENFKHKYLLMDAEISRIVDNVPDAMALYDRAIEAARDNGFVQDEAIASELAGKFWLGRGKADFAGIYLLKARDAYKKWGAERKVRDLERRYADILMVRRAPVIGRQIGDRALPADTLLDISRQIMGEIRIDRLLETIMTAAVKYVSAQKVAILMERRGCLLIEGEIEPAKNRLELLRAEPLCEETLPLSVIHYVWRTGEAISLNDARGSDAFGADPYLAERRPKSILCFKVGNLGKTSAIIYMENSITADTFASVSPEILLFLASEIGIALENARLYREQEESIRLRDNILRQYEDARYKNLQERMRPHFIYNAIHTIHGLLQIDPAVADRALVNFAEICRYFTDRSFDTLVPFQDEWRFTEHYLEFERIRLEDRFSFSLSAPPKLGPLMVPPLIIQPLVGNCIKHGFRKKRDSCRIDVRAALERDMLKIEITDNGEGLTAPDPYGRTLGNIRDRLRFHSADSDLVIENVKDGARATIMYALKKELRHG
ncbi:MAG: AAA family ATPase [Spirochaetes bacterium]|nr:AAA family ATPase [Spirochaetota bacterium]